MITWMQKHKKWLVITIWIVAIAFIGSGGIWASYGGFKIGNDKIARVGKIDIHINEYQNAYNTVIREYSKIIGVGPIRDDADAKQLGIPQIALQRLIGRAQILNFAKDLGLSVSDAEVSENLQRFSEFNDEDGLFNQAIYERYIKEAQTTKLAFEEALRDDLLAQKLLTVMNLNIGDINIPLSSVTPLEVATLQMAQSIKDKLMLKVIRSKDININVDAAELETFWQQNASNWKTPITFEIEYILVPYSQQKPTKEELEKHYENFQGDYINDKGQLLSMQEVYDKLLKDVQKIQAQSIAKREYIELKSGNKKGKIITIKDNEKYFSKNGVDFVVEDLKVTQIGQVLKPIEVDEGFVTLRLLKKEESVDKSFKEARNEAKEAFIQNRRKEILIKLAKEQLKTFKGEETEFVGKYYEGDILKLSVAHKQRLLEQIFNSEAKEGYVLFDDGVILYRVIKQSIIPDIDWLISSKHVKTSIILNVLSDYLQKTYKTTIYIDVNK